MTAESQRPPKSQAESWTIRKLVTWATEDFRTRGFESPRLDAELLLGCALNKTRIEIILEGERPLVQSELDGFRELVRRRRTGEPTAYLLGNREFYGTDFAVDKNVLIPRPDTELLVETALEKTQDRLAEGRAIDLCTGSGCVAIAFALKRRGWKITGVDLSAPAVDVAKRNALSAGLFTGVDFREGDLFAPLEREDQAHLITANPPYIPSNVIPTLELGIRGFEPHLALDGGIDGMVVTRRIVAEAPNQLQPKGVLALEIGYDQGPIVAELLRTAGFTDVEIRKDYGGHDRVVCGRLG
jgi:release factor glutamine methyltransferase